MKGHGITVKLIVGLGNPGPRYARTRHNAGFLVVDELARRQGVSFRRGKNALEAKLTAATLVKPKSFMNLSGKVVQAYLSKTVASPDDLLLIHDDLDLPLGRLRFKQGGGAGGQRGVSDTLSRIGADFLRLKIGIGRPPDGWQVEAWVLSRFQEAERALLARVISAAADAVELLLNEGLEPAMNHANGLDLREVEARAKPERLR